MRRLTSLACLVLTLLLVSAAARAEEPLGPDAFEQARVLYEHGANAYRAGRYADAEVDFRRVHNLLLMPSVLFDLALAQEKQKKWGDAAANFEIFLRDSNRVRDREKLERRVERLRELDRRARRVAGVPLSGPEPQPPEEELELDTGEVAPPAPEPLPGSAAPQPAANATTDKALSPEASTGKATGATATPNRAPERRSTRTWVWVVVGVAAVAVVAAAVGIAVSQAGEPLPSATTWTFSSGALRSSSPALELPSAALVRF